MVTASKHSGPKSVGSRGFLLDREESEHANEARTGRSLVVQFKQEQEFDRKTKEKARTKSQR